MNTNIQPPEEMAAAVPQGEASPAPVAMEGNPLASIENGDQVNVSFILFLCLFIFTFLPVPDMYQDVSSVFNRARCREVAKPTRVYQDPVNGRFRHLPTAHHATREWAEAIARHPRPASPPLQRSGVHMELSK